MYNFSQTVNYIIIISIISLVLVILGGVICGGKKWLTDDVVNLVEVV